MAWNRKINTRVSSKNAIANPVRVKQSIAVLSFTLLLAACGGDSGSGAKDPELAEGVDDGREVATLVDMGRCTSERDGDTVYVAEKLTDYLCKNNSWVDLSDVANNSSGEADSKERSSSSKGSESTDETDPSSSDNDTDVPEGFVRENISVTGVAQKGPFKFGSPLNLYELKKNLTPSGTVYKDEISSKKGDFVIPKVSLAYPYAKLEVRGLYRNEVTGEWSTDSMTFRALTDFSEERTEVNINLLTHLEYDRALYLVQEKGYSVYAAKKQAAQEIMTAFEFATAVTYSEDFAIFQNEGVSTTTSAGNATLLAISALVMGNRSDAEIQNTIDKFIADIKTDGEWNDLQTKASMADWAYDFNYSTIKASVKSWNILDIPAYETYLDIYWNNVFGLGGCSINRKDVVAPNSNKLSKNYNRYFICNGSQWNPATTFQKDTYEWATGKTGEYKKGNVTDSVYVYNGSKWEVSERETAIGLCGTSNAGVVSEYGGTYYICRNNAWGTATALEYDTYGWDDGDEGDLRIGNINKEYFYVFKYGTWRVSTDEIGNILGICEDNREGEILKPENTYYICRLETWKIASTLEYDTYNWESGINGEIKQGSVNINNYYIFKNGKWQAATSVEKDLGGCTPQKEGEVGKSENKYYICKGSAWSEATALEYDTYGEKCTNTNVGTVITGVVHDINMYYCSAGGWLSMTMWSWDIPKEARLNPKINYGIMTDSRDNKVYKTIKIGEQEWMAENLNYADSIATPSLQGNSRCYANKAEYCAVTGRLYTWAAAKKACPPDWHLPDKGDWETLLTFTEGYTSSGLALMSISGWGYVSNFTEDNFGFSAIPSSAIPPYDCDGCEGEGAYFWGSTEYENERAYCILLDTSPEWEKRDAYGYCNILDDDRYARLSVRCLKD